MTSINLASLQESHCLCAQTYDTISGTEFFSSVLNQEPRNQKRVNKDDRDPFIFKDAATGEIVPLLSFMGSKAVMGHSSLSSSLINFARERPTDISLHSLS